LTKFVAKPTTSVRVSVFVETSISLFKNMVA
jgi:hypothetical protein